MTILEIVQHTVRQAVVGDAVPHHAADLIPGVKDGHIVAPACQQHRDGQACRAGAHHSGLHAVFRGRACGHLVGVGGGDIVLDDGKVHRVVAGHPVAHAVALALVLVVAHQTAHGGERVVFKQHLACGVHLVCLEQTDDLGDVGVDGTACWHMGFLQPRQRLASSRTCNAMEFLLLSHRLGTLRCIQYYHYDTPNRCGIQVWKCKNFRRKFCYFVKKIIF